MMGERADPHDPPFTPPGCFIRTLRQFVRTLSPHTFRPGLDSACLVNDYPVPETKRASCYNHVLPISLIHFYLPDRIFQFMNLLFQ